MHKFTITGLLTLLLFFFSSSGIAGNATECGVLKDPEHPLYAPTVYGLCVAWYNADENARVAIGYKFLKRATFPVPGSEIVVVPAAEPDFYCPCWDDVTFDDICAWGDPLSAGVVKGVSGYISFSDGAIFEGLMSNKPNSMCRHVTQAYDYDPNNPTFPVERRDLSDDESLDCQAELEFMVLDRASMCPP